MRSVRVDHPGFLATVQDLGRFHHAHLGVSACGAADAFSLRAGNRLCGNRDGDAAIEVTLHGGRFVFEQETIFALTGADGSATLDDRPVALWGCLWAAAGSHLTLGRLRHGARAYLTVAGGIQVEPVLSSRSTDLRACFGGFGGRALRRGDRLPLGAPFAEPCIADARPLRYYVSGTTLRVTRGPQFDLFPRDVLDRLCSGTYTVRDDSDRLGLRLAGVPILPANGSELLTEGVSLGAIQIPPDGQPIILFVDQQTTGGYPKPAGIIAADLARVGQLAPRTSARFVEVTLEVAYAALRDREQRLDSLLGAAR